jgi:biotin transport system permease protein
VKAGELLAHVPGRSVVHRAPAGLKLAGLTGLTAVLFTLGRPEVSAGALVLVLVTGVGVARLPIGVLLTPARALRWWLLLLFALNLVTADAAGAVTVTLRVLAVALAATVLTATTRVTELTALVERLARPLALVGVRPTRVGLAVALTLRFIPLVAERTERVREAQVARGGEVRGVRGMVTLLVPVLVQLLQLAATTAEALDARGADDAPGRSRRTRR